MRFIIAVFLVLQFASISFAQQWISTAAVALVTSSALLALVYAIGIGFNNEELKLLSSEELYQVIVTAVMIGVFLGAESFLDAFSATFGLGGGLQESSLTIVDSILTEQSNAFNNLKTFSKDLGKESSEALYCNWNGIGFNTAACSSFRSLAPAVTLSMQTVSLSIAELSSLRTLLHFADNYSFTVLLPLGILLRTFKFSRGAGGVLIGIAIALYFFTPLSVIFMNIVVSSAAPTTPLADLPYPECDAAAYTTISGDFNYKNVFGGGRGLLSDIVEFAIDAPLAAVLTPTTFVTGDYDIPAIGGVAGDFIANEVPGSFGTFVIVAQNIDDYIYAFLIKGTFTTIVALLTFIASLRAVARLAGADVDVSVLARLV